MPVAKNNSDAHAASGGRYEPDRHVGLERRQLLGPAGTPISRTSWTADICKDAAADGIRSDFICGDEENFEFGKDCSVPEIECLLAEARTISRPPDHKTHWLDWRHQHQARSRWFHKRARLARDAEIAPSVMRLKFAV